MMLNRLPMKIAFRQMWGSQFIGNIGITRVDTLYSEFDHVQSLGDILLKSPYSFRPKVPTK